MQLERFHIQTWADLAKAFLRYYKYNLDMAPNRMQLQNLSQKKEESFKEYAKVEKNGIPCTSTTSRVGASRYVHGNSARDILWKDGRKRLIRVFDLVTIRERIEACVKSGKIQGASPSTPYNSKRHISNFSKNKEGEVNVVASHPRAQQPLVIPQEQQQNRFERPPRKFDPFPMPHNQLL